MTKRKFRNPNPQLFPLLRKAEVGLCDLTIWSLEFIWNLSFEIWTLRLAGTQGFPSVSFPPFDRPLLSCMDFKACNADNWF